MISLRFQEAVQGKLLVDFLGGALGPLEGRWHRECGDVDRCGTFEKSSVETASILEHLHFGRIDFHKCSECSSLCDISGHVSTYSPATLYGFGTGQRLLHRMLLRCCSNENEIGKLRSDMAGPTLVHGQQIYESMTSSIPLLNHGISWLFLGASNI